MTAVFRIDDHPCHEDEHHFRNVVGSCQCRAFGIGEDSLPHPQPDCVDRYGARMPPWFWLGMLASLIAYAGWFAIGPYILGR